MNTHVYNTTHHNVNRLLGSWKELESGALTPHHRIPGTTRADLPLIFKALVQNKSSLNVSDTSNTNIKNSIKTFLDADYNLDSVKKKLSEGINNKLIVEDTNELLRILSDETLYDLVDIVIPILRFSGLLLFLSFFFSLSSSLFLYI